MVFLNEEGEHRGPLTSYPPIRLRCLLTMPNTSGSDFEQTSPPFWTAEDWKAAENGRFRDVSVDNLLDIHRKSCA